MNDHQFTFRHHSAEATHAAWSTSLWFSCKSSQTPRRTPGTLKVIQTLRWKQFESCVTLLSSQQMNNGSPFPREPVHPQPASQLVRWKVDDLALITLESVFSERRVWTLWRLMFSRRIVAEKGDHALLFFYNGSTEKGWRGWTLNGGATKQHLLNHRWL